MIPRKKTIRERGRLAIHGWLQSHEPLQPGPFGPVKAAMIVHYRAEVAQAEDRLAVMTEALALAERLTAIEHVHSGQAPYRRLTEEV